MTDSTTEPNKNISSVNSNSTANAAGIVPDIKSESVEVAKPDVSSNIKNPVSLSYLMMATDCRYSLEFPETATVLDAKTALRGNWPADFGPKPTKVEQIRLIHGGKFIEDHTTLESNDIHEGKATVHVIIRPLEAFDKTCLLAHGAPTAPKQNLNQDPKQAASIDIVGNVVGDVNGTTLSGFFNADIQASLASMFGGPSTSTNTASAAAVAVTIPASNPGIVQNTLAPVIMTRIENEETTIVVTDTYIIPTTDTVGATETITAIQLNPVAVEVTEIVQVTETSMCPARPTTTNFVTNTITSTLSLMPAQPVIVMTQRNTIPVTAQTGVTITLTDTGIIPDVETVRTTVATATGTVTRTQNQVVTIVTTENGETTTIVLQ
ncbi:hypothetical protein H4219_001254 [Mycoemilia scoparia]|uniref:Ubiquitin-like domain-containing protein n=1 Tax=Mycoemilia scoparia TaxID=417184 RepID=A0A9W8A3X4_9FUNG|nr:hypothetical protein H4219_001254 [Mycoemilia scoparia]